ncbi:MAG: hypothetical protein DU429_07250 [Candidatus Tokpelaia sp.]|nr:MAG: hypothetical protein DU430_08650 [Candidatus Tokpelaia sp.]KAA6205764.1 MAG: hypothetical protein DU429_07250 [Candidatus Tokpelaia sp.]
MQPFGRMLFSIAPNGMIGCLEFLLLSVVSWLVFTIALVILGVAWGGGLLAAVLPFTASAYGAGGFGFVAVMFSLGALVCLLAGLVLSVLFGARLLQLRLIDIGLGKNLSVPGVCARFWVCLLASIACSLFTPLALVLLVFCCVCQGKTYADNRDVFKPVPLVPPLDELEVQMHRRK